ncbi:MAG: phosphatase PAP2 family protein [Flavobacteriaceae bacterium]|nr:phosphatase PAP2 family protein [Flavobacteriaceae bacterium]
MRNSKFLFLFFLLFVTFSSQCQHVESDSINTWELFKYDGKTTFNGIKYSLLRPKDWKGKDYAKLGALISGTVLLSFADDEVRRFSQRQADDFPEVIRDFGWYFGSPQNYFMANVGLYGVGLLTKNEKIRKTSVLIISSSVVSGLISSISKSAFGRARPSSGLGNHYFKPFSKEGRFHSFPSGHTTLSVTMAHAIAKQFDSFWVKTGIYAIGAIPPISRLIDDEHWISDIAFSAAISIIVVDSIDGFLNRTKAYDYPEKEKTISWNLRFSTNQIGIVGSF